MRWVLVALLRAYRAVVSPLYGPVCRYHPSCSAYALSAVERFGAVRGTWMAVRRVARCNPWSFGGYDPVPGTDPEHDAERAGRHGVDPDVGGAPAGPLGRGRRAEPVVRDDGEREPEPVRPGAVRHQDDELSTVAPSREAHP